MNEAPSISTPDNKISVPKARIVVIETLYHQEVSKQPTTLPTRRFLRWLDTDEQPYIRSFTLTEEWKKLDTGWITSASSVVIVNPHKIRHAGHSGLTPLQKQEWDSYTIDISLRGDGTPDLYVPPGESIRINPSRLDLIHLRMRKWSDKVQVILTPN